MFGSCSVTPQASAAPSSSFFVVDCSMADGEAVSPESDLEMAESAEHIQVMLRQESGAYLPCMNYLTSELDKAGDDGSGIVSEAWRRKLCEWCYEVVDHFSFDREAVAIAMDYLDRSVAATSRSTGTSVGKRNFQLLAVTSLYMALKIHGESDEASSRSYPRQRLRIDAFVELSRGFFPIAVIEATESKILTSLNWRINPPTCLRFVASYLRLCPTCTDPQDKQAQAKIMGSILDISKYLAELSVCVSTFSFDHKNSLAAYASVLLGLEVLKTSPLPTPTHMREAIVENMSQATGHHPSDPDVLRVCEDLQGLCPSMFKNIRLGTVVYPSPTDTQDHKTERLSGKTSPVCVVSEDLNESPRKRSRSERS